VQPGIQTSPKGLLALCAAFVGFGVIVFFKALTAIRTHAYIAELSRRRQIDGYEGMLIAACAVVVGVGGVWAVLRKR
jgi:hypothetical protein